MKMYEKPHALNDYLDKKFECSCGKTHYAPLKAVYIGSGAIKEIASFLQEHGYQHPFLIADNVTYKIAGEACMKILGEFQIDAVIHVISHAGLDEATVGELLIDMPMETDILIAVGTGAINDMTRFFSFRTGRPFMTVATAAPMDGFASSIAAIYVNNLKTTFNAQTPVAIVGDTDILKNAPYRMIAAGLGDLLGKFTCLCDWKLSALINKEHYCAQIVELVETCAKNVLQNADKASQRDPKVIGDIMEGLVLSGVAMSLYGNSRSASGCEHHMSHYWEMMFEQKGERPAPHGTQVGVGTVLVLKLVEALLAMPKIDFEQARIHAKSYNEAEWEQNIHMAYGPAAEGIIDMEKSAQKNAAEGCLKRIDAIEANWSDIQKLLADLPSSGSIIELLQQLESPYLPSQIGIDDAMLKNTMLYCKEVRNRYTILQLLWDLDLLDSLSDKVIRELGELAQ